jgi:hypothetical protein
VLASLSSPLYIDAFRLALGTLARIYGEPRAYGGASSPRSAEACFVAPMRPDAIAGWNV